MKAKRKRARKKLTAAEAADYVRDRLRGLLYERYQRRPSPPPVLPVTPPDALCNAALFQHLWYARDQLHDAHGWISGLRRTPSRQRRIDRYAKAIKEIQALQAELERRAGLDAQAAAVLFLRLEPAVQRS